MNLVELELDETLADFEVQDWIDNVFSVQYPDIKARIKKGCSGLCHKKDEWHYVKDGDLPKENQEVLVYFTLPDKSKNDVMIAEFENNDFNYVDLQDVICWKEIILPKGFEK